MAKRGQVEELAIMWTLLRRARAVACVKFSRKCSCSYFKAGEASSAPLEHSHCCVVVAEENPIDFAEERGDVGSQLRQSISSSGERGAIYKSRKAKMS
jgi:hypothetical protein